MCIRDRLQACKLEGADREKAESVLDEEAEVEGFALSTGPAQYSARLLVVKAPPSPDAISRGLGDRASTSTLMCPW